jgi:1,4-dihydroxy-2-naphthoyl-CoA hydrolase
MKPKLPPQLPLVLEQGFDGLYGLELIDLSDEIARGRVIVREELKQPAGLVHGGVHAAIAESLASFGTALAVAPEGKLCMGLSNQTSFLRPVTEGVIEAVATRRHRGRTTWVWEVEISDDQERLCVISRVTIAVRDRPEK